MKSKQKQTMPRGRRRTKGSKFSTEFQEYGAPRPYGWAWPVLNLAGRASLLSFFPPFRNKSAHGFVDVPLSFAQTADKILGEKQLLRNNVGLKHELDGIRLCNSNPASKHPCWNKHELPTELLRKALSQSAAWAVQEFEVVQRALARLYAVAWFGRGADSAEAKQQLEQLIPVGNSHPITKYIPEIATKFREIRGWILESNELMKQEFPREINRVRKLAELYDEPTGVISDGLKQAEIPFLAARLSHVLGLRVETVRKSLAKLPASLV
jgi:hypothetical protein